MKQFWALLLFILSGCTTAPLWAEEMKQIALTSQLISDFDYTGVADLQFAINGVNYTGTATAPFKTYLSIKINLPKNTSILKIKTCGRSVPPIINPVGVYEYVYQPRPHLEEGFCLMYIDVLNKDGTIKSAEIDFLDKEDMTAFSTCNGVTTQEKGASICQVPVDKKGRGFLNVIQVAEDVDAITSKGCPIMKCTAIWCYWQTQAGDCYYRMVGLKNKQIFRLVTRGYLEN
jgi:hypothetical protein